MMLATINDRNPLESAVTLHSKCATPSITKENEIINFDCLVTQYWQAIYNLAFRMLSDEADAADAAQTTFMLAYRYLKSFRGGSFRAWIMRIASNVCFDELRNRYKLASTPFDDLTQDPFLEGEPLEHIPDTSQVTPEDSVERAELDRFVQAGLNALSPDYRIALVLVNLQGLDYKEISTIVGRPLGTIKSRVARARLRMRDYLTQYFEITPR